VQRQRARHGGVEQMRQELARLVSGMGCGHSVSPPTQDCDAVTRQPSGRMSSPSSDQS
jgi:hypothetical protein